MQTTTQDDAIQLHDGSEISGVSPAELAVGPVARVADRPDLNSTAANTARTLVVRGRIASPGPSVLDYNALPPEVARRLHQTENRIRDLRRREITTILEIGRELLQAKDDLVQYGQFVNWVEARCDITIRTAQNYMALALFVADRHEIVSHLRPTTLYNLIKAPNVIKSPVRDRLFAGERLSDPEIHDLIDAVKPEHKQAKKKQPAKENEDEIIEGDQAVRRTNAKQAANILSKLGSDLDLFVQYAKDLSLTEILEYVTIVPQQNKPEPVGALSPLPMAKFWDTEEARRNGPDR
jgi:hypothetical protein